MRKSLILLLSGLLLQLTTFAQSQSLIILGDNVPLYAQPNYQSQILITLDWDAEVVGWPESSSWYGVRDALGREGYVPVWYAMETWMTDPNDLRAKRVTPSASTLYRMMRFFRRNDKVEKAEEFALRIIQNHNEEEFPDKDFSCYKLGHLAYIHMVSDGETGVIYDDYLPVFAHKVLEVAETPSIKAMAHYHLARSKALTGESKAALMELIAVVEKYPGDFARNECEPEKADSWFYKPERCKRLFCAISMIQTPQALEEARNELSRLIVEGSPATQEIAQELLQNIGTMPYARDESIWY